MNGSRASAGPDGGRRPIFFFVRDEPLFLFHGSVRVHHTGVCGSGRSSFRGDAMSTPGFIQYNPRARLGWPSGDQNTDRQEVAAHGSFRDDG